MKASQSTPDNGTAREVRERNHNTLVCDLVKSTHEFICRDSKVIAKWIYVEGKLIRIL